MTDLREILAAATPGPWEADGAPWNRIVCSATNRVCFVAHSDGLNDERDIATSELVALAPDLAAEVLALRDQVETAYVRGFHDAQSKSILDGILEIVDSPELVALREENARKTAALLKAQETLRELVDRDAAYDGNRIIITADSHGDAIGRMSRARAALSDIKAITGGGE